MTCKLHDNSKEHNLGISSALQMYGPDPMHTLSGEVKACFSMLSGSVYCGTTKAAQTIRNYEAETNKRYMPAEVKSACSLCCLCRPCSLVCTPIYFVHALPKCSACVQAVAKGKKKLKATGNPKPYPFVLPTEAQKQVSHILSDMTDEGHIPNGWGTKNLPHCFEHPGYLKAHDWLLLAGPIGKYALQVRSYNISRGMLRHLPIMHFSKQCFILLTPMKA